jgi:hypothetical protein
VAVSASSSSGFRSWSLVAFGSLRIISDILFSCMHCEEVKHHRGGVHKAWGAWNIGVVTLMDCVRGSYGISLRPCNAIMRYECIEDGEQYPGINRWDE